MKAVCSTRLPPRPTLQVGGQGPAGVRRHVALNLFTCHAQLLEHTIEVGVLHCEAAEDRWGALGFESSAMNCRSRGSDGEGSFGWHFYFSVGHVLCRKGFGLRIPAGKQGLQQHENFMHMEKRSATASGKAGC